MRATIGNDEKNSKKGQGKKFSAAATKIKEEMKFFFK